jgi:phage terminase large subunit-like protein
VPPGSTTGSKKHIGFPQARHDDLVDTTSLALSRMRNHGGARVRVLVDRSPPRRMFGG